MRTGSFELAIFENVLEDVEDGGDDDEEVVEWLTGNLTGRDRRG